MLSQTVFPPDIRLEKEIKSLNKFGYEIAVLCNQYQKNLNPDFKFCKIIRVKALFKNININKIINFPLVTESQISNTCHQTNVSI